MLDTVGPESHEPTSLWDIAKRAKTCKDHRFQDLYRMLDADLLLECWKERVLSARVRSRRFPGPRGQAERAGEPVRNLTGQSRRCLGRAC